MDFICILRQASWDCDQSISFFVKYPFQFVHELGNSSQEVLKRIYVLHKSKRITQSSNFFFKFSYYFYVRKDGSKYFKNRNWHPFWVEQFLRKKHFKKEGKARNISRKNGKRFDRKSERNHENLTFVRVASSSTIGILFVSFHQVNTSLIWSVQMLAVNLV